MGGGMAMGGGMGGMMGMAGGMGSMGHPQPMGGGSVIIVSNLAEGVCFHISLFFEQIIETQIK